jgi:hypothetical protein
MLCTEGVEIVSFCADLPTLMQCLHSSARSGRATRLFHWPEMQRLRGSIIWRATLERAISIKAATRDPEQRHPFQGICRLTMTPLRLLTFVLAWGSLIVAFTQSRPFKHALLARQDSDTDALTVDLGYGVYQGYFNTSTNINTWKGCAKLEDVVSFTN